MQLNIESLGQPVSCTPCARYSHATGVTVARSRRRCCCAGGVSGEMVGGGPLRAGEGFSP